MVEGTRAGAWPSETRHAVLIVKSNRGEIILDNQTPEILSPYETRYRYLSPERGRSQCRRVSYDRERRKRP
jgi:predicted transglutaminase-like cysteine proteinase